MTLVRLQFLATVVLALLSGGVYTMSYFIDVEGVVANAFGASLLDQDVAGQPLDGLLCTQNDRAETTVYSSNLGTMPFAYYFSVAHATGPLCGGLSATLARGGQELFAGPLLDLVSGELVLEANDTDELFLTVRLTPGSSDVGTCVFDTSWSAVQFMGTVMPGYSDTETITHTIQGSGTGIGAGCIATSTVDLYLNKHISGETLGYALADFSYRIVGNGLDIIAPHDSYTPLPVGTYTIEELVPDDFVKSDWRIGWYGQCERGSTFTTTITIEERHINYGTLYCEADNQYRPSHGDNLTTKPDTTAAVRTASDSGIESGARTRRDGGSPNRSGDSTTAAVVQASTTSETEIETIAPQSPEEVVSDDEHAPAAIDEASVTDADATVLIEDGEIDNGESESEVELTEVEAVDDGSSADAPASDGDDQPEA